MFQFKEFKNLADGEIKLGIKSKDEPNIEMGYSPRYGFSITHIKDNEDIGVIYFSVGNTRNHFLTGHLSFGVSPVYSGHNYARKACLLMIPVMEAHGFDIVYIGAKKDNIASLKTIEKLGARKLTKTDIPDESVLDELKDKEIQMYLWDFNET